MKSKNSSEAMSATDKARVFQNAIALLDYGCCEPSDRADIT